MHPTTGGVIHGHADVVPAEITVTTAVLRPETTVRVQRWGGEWREAYAVLNDQDREALIVALGGKP